MPANLSVELFGLKFKNPIIPAAGPNVGTGKQCAAAAKGGAGAILAKTVSAKAAEVPRPDMWKYDKLGMLNAELWTEMTLEEWEQREFPIARAAAKEYGIPFIGSVGYTPEDLRSVGPRVEAAGVNAIEFTIHYLDPARVVETAQALRESVKVPIIGKFSPHAGDLGELAMQIDPYVDAFACINSVGPTMLLNIERVEPVLGSEFGYGWLSGPPIKPIALRCVFEVARRTTKPVIGIGGITCGKDVIEFLMCGASLVEICTVVMYKGQDVHAKIAREVQEWLDAHGYDDVNQIRGLYLKKYGIGQRVVTQKEEAPVVIEENCVKCTICEKVCFYDAISAPPKTLAKVFDAPCFQCGLCVAACPTDALVFKPRDGVTMKIPAALEATDAETGERRAWPKLA